MAPCQGGEQTGRNLRCIGERLVEHPGQGRDQVERLVRGDVELGVLGAEPVGDRTRERGLVEARLAKPDREGPDRLCALGLHQGRDQGGIDAAGKERADRHVGDHPAANRVLQQEVEFGHDLGVRALLGIAGGQSDRVPVGGQARGTARVDLQPMAGGELAHAAVDALRARHEPPAQERGQRVAIHLAWRRGAGHERLQLRAEGHEFPGAGPVERLLAQAVARQDELAVPAVPGREGEHADRPLQRRRDAPGGQRFHQHLGVRVPAKPLARPAEFGAQVAGVVDLAVEHQDHPAVVRHHRLRTGGREIDHREPRVAEGDSRGCVDPGTAIVGATMMQRGGHGRDGLAQRLGSGGRVPIPKPGDPAHAQTIAPAGKGTGAMPPGVRPCCSRLEHGELALPGRDLRATSLRHASTGHRPRRDKPAHHGTDAARHIAEAEHSHFGEEKVKPRGPCKA